MFQDTGDHSSEDMGLRPSGKGRGRLSLPSLRTFESFKNPVFRLYYGALLGQRASANMQMMSRSLLVYHLTGSATILGLMSLANALPMLFLALFGGVIADRVQKKYVLLVGQLCSALISLGIALCLTTGYLSAERAGSWWILIVASVLQGTVMGLMVPSRQAIVPEIVGEEQLMNAIALNNMAMNTLRLIAPAVAGFLIGDEYNFELVYFAMTGMYVVAVIFIILMPHTSKVTAIRRSIFADIFEGLRYVKSRTTILLLLVFILLVILLSRPYMVLMPIFTEDILMVGPAGMGILMSISGAGAIVGALILASLPNRRRGMLLLVGCLILGSALIGFSFSTSWPLSIVLIVVVGVGQTARMTLGNTLVQYYVDDDYRGRVMSIYTMDFGFTSLGTFIAGLMADTAIGVEWTVGGFAMLLVTLTVMVAVFFPQIRKLQ
ncbi:MAG TPA: MFS transporter [Dehalococcoidia bacterium]|nr:MFS transporter [Dehalococcoidia bacterium]